MKSCGIVAWNLSQHYVVRLSSNPGKTSRPTTQLHVHCSLWNYRGIEAGRKQTYEREAVVERMTVSLLSRGGKFELITVTSQDMVLNVMVKCGLEC